MKTSLVSLLSWALCAAGMLALAGAGLEAAPRPNIVLILADDLGWSDIGCYGGEIPTPNIDALANGGLRFTQFYNNAVCGPTRVSLLTGLYGQRVGHTGRNWNQPTDYSRAITLGEGLKRAGYHTMVVGKWQEPDLPARRGFDRFYGTQTQGKISYFQEVNTCPFFLDEKRVRLPDDFYLTDTITDYALRFLREQAKGAETRKQPFFLYVAHVAPHWPLHAREAEIALHRARYRENGWEQWRAQRFARQRDAGLVNSDRPAPLPSRIHAWRDDPYKDWQAERMAVHSALVASIDRSTGRILDLLRETGQLDNTLILFLSDNGAAADGDVKPTTQWAGFSPGAEANRTWAVSGMPVRPGSGPDTMPGPPDTFAAYGLAWALTSTTPFRSTKMTGYEGGIRTPLIAHWPQGIAARGALVRDVGHIIDFMPTFLELAGTEYPTVVGDRKPLPPDGRSLTPVFRGEPLGPREYLAWRVPQDRVLRAGDWKIVSKDESSRWELYDLATDVTETTDLARRHPGIVKELAGKWQAWADSCRAQP